MRSAGRGCAGECRTVPSPRGAGRQAGSPAAAGWVLAGGSIRSAAVGSSLPLCGEGGQLRRREAEVQLVDVGWLRDRPGDAATGTYLQGQVTVQPELYLKPILLAVDRHAEDAQQPAGGLGHRVVTVTDEQTSNPGSGVADEEAGLPD